MNRFQVEIQEKYTKSAILIGSWTDWSKWSKWRNLTDNQPLDIYKCQIVTVTFRTGVYSIHPCNYESDYGSWPCSKNDLCFQCSHGLCLPRQVGKLYTSSRVHVLISYHSSLLPFIDVSKWKRKLVTVWIFAGNENFLTKTLSATLLVDIFHRLFLSTEMWWLHGRTRNLLRECHHKLFCKRICWLFKILLFLQVVFLVVFPFQCLFLFRISYWSHRLYKERG